MWNNKVGNLMLLGILLFVFPVLSFYKEGHSLIGEIVDNMISEQAKANINMSLKIISPWADSIRKNSTYNWAKPLHYITTNVDENHTKGECSVNPKAFDGNNLYSALVNYTNRISNKETRTEEDLKFFVHFYEDLYQPLHMSSMYRGGNQIDIDFFGRDTNLHGVWDGYLLRNRIKEKGKKKKYIEYILEETKNRQAYKPFDYKFWISHNNQINCCCVYYNLSSSITMNYYNKNKIVIEQLLIMSSINLRDIIEKFYG